MGLGKPSFVKLNPQGDLVCMICETNKETQISIWSFAEEKKIIMEHHWKLDNFGSVQSVNWHQEGHKIALCSYNKIASYEATKISEPIVVPLRTFVNEGKLLCCRWSPDDILFFGGLFEYIFGVTLNGFIVRTIRPFMRTRDIIFRSKDEIFALGATKPILLRYNTK